MRRIRWRRAYTYEAAILLLVSSVLCAAVLHSSRSLPFRDQFATAGLSNWQSIGGNWSTHGGTLLNESDERGAKLLTGSSGWSNYSLSADVEVLGSDGDAGLVIRSSDEELGSDSYNGYYAGLRTHDGMFVLGRANHGWMEAQTVPIAGGIHPEHWYRLQVMAVDCTIAAVVTDPATGTRSSALMRDHACVHSGRIGLRSYSTEARWRNVVAGKSSLSDIAALHAVAQSWAATALYQSEVSYLQRGQISDDQAIASSMRAVPPATNIATLRYASAASRHPVTIRGTVVLRQPIMFVQDSTGGIAIPIPNPERFAAGEEVQATGDLVQGTFSLELRDAFVRVLGPGKPLPPKSVTASEAATGVYDGQYIELTARLRKNDARSATPALCMDADSQSFCAILPKGPEPSSLRDLPKNSLVKVRGVEAVDPRYTNNQTPFVLLLSSSDAVELLARPPWWSLQNMVWIGPIFFILLLLIQMARVHYRHMQMHAVVEERQRLGQEMHDTLAQSFAGIGYQLKAVRSGLETGKSGISEHVNLAIEMARHSHEEARRSIASMNPELMQSTHLARALEEGARHMVEGTSLKIVANTVGDPKRTPPRVLDALFRIGQEAIANAIRHASPKTVQILVAYQARAIQLVVEDDGRGFDADADLPGFGVRGMRRHADAIAAEFHIISKPSQGARVEARVQLKPEFAIPTLFSKYR